MSDLSNIVIGSAQFGMNYGISNTNGKTNQKDINQILSAAISMGIDCIDCAQAYGTAELAIGNALIQTKTSSKFKVITKISPNLNPNDFENITSSIIKSKQIVNQECLWGVMLHREEWLEYWDKGLKDCLIKLKKRGVIQHIGVSVYTTKYKDIICNDPDLELIQIPHSIWHFQEERISFLESLKLHSKKIFIRSIFIQGLLTMKSEQVKKMLPIAYNASRKWEEFINNKGISKTEICIQYAKSLNEKIVIGLESKEQFDENIEMYKINNINHELFNGLKEKMQPFVSDKIIDPSKW